MATLPITPEWLKRTYLFGVNLTDENDNEYPDELFQHAIRSAIGTLNMECHVQLIPKEVTERHDLDWHKWREFGLTEVDRRPIQAGEPIKVRFMYGDDEIIDIPSEWIQCFLPEKGQIELTPTSLTQSAGLITQQGFWWLFPQGAGGRIPGWYEVTYTAGFPLGDLVLIHDLVSDVTKIYSGHRIETEGSPAVHSAPDTTNTLVAHGGEHVYDLQGRELADAITQTNADVAAYEAHRQDAAVHGAADAVNVITAPIATDLDSLVVRLNDLHYVLGQHLLQVTGSVHGQADDGRKITAGKVRNDYVRLPDADDEYQTPIRDTIGKLAAIHALDIAGDLLIGAGIASRSLSMDSLSESIDTTQSAMYAGYSARIIERYLKDLNGQSAAQPGLLDKIRSFYHGGFQMEALA